MSEKLDYNTFSSKYTDREYVGSGGFARVYKCLDIAKNHYVALKIADVRPEHKEFTLRREVELVNQLEHHRNIARYDACFRFNSISGETDVAVMKFYENGNLEQFLGEKEITLLDKKFIIDGILRGVSFLHHHNIVHRDLKAQNVLLDREDGVWVPKITDFGLARNSEGNHTMTNSSIGLSFAYAAPEQVQHKRIQKNVDLWAAGVIIYRIIAGELPFLNNRNGEERSTQSQLELSQRIVNVKIPDKIHSLPEPYQTIIKRCLVLDPTERAQTAEELRELLAGRNRGRQRPPSLVPINPPKSEPADETVLISPKQPAAAIPPSEASSPATQPDYLSTPPVYVNPRTTSPPAEPRPPIIPPSEYTTPKENHTLIVGKILIPESMDSPPPTPQSNTPKSGDPSGFKWMYLLVILLIGGLGYVGYILLSDKIETVTDSPTPVDAPLFSNENRANEDARPNKPALDDHLRQLQAVMIKWPGEYRPFYIAAKNRIYAGDFPAATGFLELAQEKAEAGNLLEKQTGTKARAQMQKEMDRDREDPVIRDFFIKMGIN